MQKLQDLLEDDYEDFESSENVEKLSYMIASELWRVSSIDCLASLRNIL